MEKLYKSFAITNQKNFDKIIRNLMKDNFKPFKPKGKNIKPLFGSK